jgi:hypothetical protein
MRAIRAPEQMIDDVFILTSLVIHHANDNAKQHPKSKDVVAPYSYKRRLQSCESPSYLFSITVNFAWFALRKYSRDATA